MADGSHGYRAALGRRRLMPVLISSSRAMVGSRPFIFFSISYAEWFWRAPVLQTVPVCSWCQARGIWSCHTRNTLHMKLSNPFSRLL